MREKCRADLAPEDSDQPRPPPALASGGARLGRGQNGVDTTGAAAEVMNFDRLLGTIKVGSREYPKSPCQKT